jgi:glucokinase
VMIDILAVGVAIRRAVPSAEMTEAVAKARSESTDDAVAVLDWLSHGAASSAAD